MPRRVSLVASILIPLLLMFAVSTEANQSPRRGTVIDASTGAPLAGANVVGGGAATIADRDGHFRLNVAANDTITVTFIGYEPVVIAETQTSLPLMVMMHQIALEVAQIVVTGGLLEERLEEVAASVTVIGREDLQAAGSHHLQDLTQSIPNLTYAGGTSRPRYFQIRGMGERSHYAGEGPPSFSVGFVMDDVDLSGMGMAGLVHDVGQVEVFKGPQSTIFGPNAMAGLINMQSSDPTQVLSLSGTLSLGNDDLQRYAGHLNVPLQDNLAVRLSYTAGRSNGFRDNVYLGVDDTNRHREDMVRAKLRWLDLRSGTSLLVTAFRANLNNGYDAWTPDNNKQLETYSDTPGRDRQKTVALSLRGEMPLRRPEAELVWITSYSETELGHSFDGDWGNDDFWLQEHGHDPEVEGWRYDFFDSNRRKRANLSQEIRLLKPNATRLGDLVVGAYAKSLSETDDADGYLFAQSDTHLDSKFEVTDLAFYGQLDKALSNQLRLSANLRLDRNATAYAGTTRFPGIDPQQIDFDVTQWLTGGKLAVTYSMEEGRMAFAALSRGFRAGGVNQHPYLAAENRPFDPEYIRNFEIGYRLTGARSTTSLVLFHAMRSNQQVNLSSQQDAGDPNSFFYFTANAVEGRNSGVELEQTFRASTALQLSGSFGYLKTHIDRYRFAAAEGSELALGGRAAAHAPEYNLRFAARYRDRRGFEGRAEVSAADEFFFSDSHDQKSEAYQLLNGSLGYGTGSWSISLWGRNLLDERYAVRGFFFGLAPPDFANTLYVSYGDPRQIGVTLKTSFFDTSGRT
jgi:iron complex outermembrane receptor protein